MAIELKTTHVLIRLGNEKKLFCVWGYSKSFITPNGLYYQLNISFGVTEINGDSIWW